MSMKMKKKNKNLLSKFNNKDNYLQKIELNEIQKEQLVSKGVYCR